MLTPFQIRFDEGGTYIQVPELDPSDRRPRRDEASRWRRTGPARLLESLRRWGSAVVRRTAGWPRPQVSAKGSILHFSTDQKEPARSRP